MILLLISFQRSREDMKPYKVYSVTQNVMSYEESTLTYSLNKG